MKKIIITLLILIGSILSVAAFGTLYESETLNINGKKIGVWKQIYINGESDNTIYFGARQVGEENKYYKYENQKLIEIKEEDQIVSDYTNSDKWAVKKLYKEGYDTNSNKITVTIAGKKYGPYNADFYNSSEISDKSFTYSFDGENGERITNIVTFYDAKKQIVKKEIKAIPKIDKILNKFFVKVDKKGDIKAKALYKKIIKKIDSIISKTKSSKKKKLLEYIKVKFEEKVK